MEEGHTPLATVHWKTLVPALKPVIVELANAGFTTVPVPESFIQLPVPIKGVAAFKVVEVEQINWLTPALEVLGFSETVMVILEVEELQTVEIFHSKTLAPTLNPETLLVGDPGFENDPVPETTDQEPVPLNGKFAASVVEKAQMD